MPVSGQDQQLWDDVEPLLAPPSGSPLSLHQAAETLGVEPKLLEKSLKTAVRHGRMVQIAKNRYLPARHLARLGFEAETLATSAPDGCFTAAAYCEHTVTGRNFAIDLLECFDRLGFTERDGNQRRVRRPADEVFGASDGSSRGRGSHPGGAPGLQIR